MTNDLDRCHRLMAERDHISPIMYYSDIQSVLHNAQALADEVPGLVQEIEELRNFKNKVEPLIDSLKLISMDS